MSDSIPYLQIPGVKSRELLARRCSVEDDLNLAPQRIEAVALDRVQHAHEHLSTGSAAVRHVDRIDRTVMGEIRVLSTRWQLFEVDGE